MLIHSHPLLDKNYQIRKRVQSAYLNLLDIYVPDWMLQRAEYTLKKKGISVNFTSLAIAVYILYKYELGIPHEAFLLLIRETRTQWRKTFRKIKHAFFKVSETDEDMIEVSLS
ncbi:hypothetical protein [Sulfurisphaera ohwakuensis]|uniref:hypothetical protein n=1 Tax=Sulfurisphaera ohwakuensis TaxID=69656 RepID=UPI0036F26AC5